MDLINLENGKDTKQVNNDKDYDHDDNNYSDRLYTAPNPAPPPARS